MNKTETPISQYRSVKHKLFVGRVALEIPQIRCGTTGKFSSSNPSFMQHEQGHPTRKAASLNRWGCK